MTGWNNGTGVDKDEVACTGWWIYRNDDKKGTQLTGWTSRTTVDKKELGLLDGIVE